MSDSNPTPEVPHGIVSNAEAPPVPAFHETVNAPGNLPFAIAGGAVAALIGAVLWAAITVNTKYQIGFMAIGVGLLVGFAVGKCGRGSTLPFQITGAVFALLGCVLGNFFSIVGFASEQAERTFFDVLASIDYSIVPGIMTEAASPMDFLFYAIAIYEGFGFSTRYAAPAAQ